MPDRNERDVVVVGAGIIGICAALALLEKGFRARVVDRDPPAEGASAGNAGVVSPWSCVPQSLPGLWKKLPRWLLDPEGPVALRPAYLPRLAPWLIRFLRAGSPERIPDIADAMLTVNQPCAALYAQLLAGTGHEDLVRDSMYLHLFRDPAGADLERLPWRLRRSRGVPLRALTGEQLREIEPDVSPDYRAAVAVTGQARATNPGRLGKVLADKAQSAGATFVRGRVHRLAPRPDAAITVQSDAGELRASRVVLAAGAWSARLLTPLGVRVPLEAERGYHVVFPDPGVRLENSVQDAERMFATSSMEMGVRCAGTAEFSGLDSPPNPRRARVLVRHAKRLLPALNTENSVEWSGVRPATPDSLPCIGPVPGHPRIIAAFGHGHLGLTGAPMTARMVASLAAAEPLNLDLAPYRLDRF